MAALVQSYPQQSASATMLQTRPLPAPSTGNQQYATTGSHSHRNSFHGLPTGMASPGMYRPGVTPIQPYAFTATPSLNTNAQWQQFGNFRGASSPAVPQAVAPTFVDASGRSRYAASASMTNLSYNPSMGVGKSGSRDDSSIRPPRTITTAPRPQSAYMSGTSPQLSFAQAAPVKASPDRYRRPGSQQQRSQNSSQPSGSGMSAVSHLYNSQNNMKEQRRGSGSGSPTAPNRPSSFYSSVPGSSADDIQLHRQPSQDDASKRLRRHSMHNLDSADYPKPLTPHREPASPEESTRLEASTSSSSPQNSDKDTKALRVVPDAGGAVDNSAMQLRNGSSESLASTRSSSHSRPSSSANRNASTPAGNLSSLTIASDDAANKQDYPKLVNIPPRGSSTDAGKRINSPSPLSAQPVTMASDKESHMSSSSLGDALDLQSPTSPSMPNGNLDSPAAKQLAAINQKGAKGKSKTSRLRRAFSFGSAADFRKAAGPDDAADLGDKGETSKLHKEPTAEELYDAEQERIAKKQEEGGIGNSIYGGKLFSGSTDNLSISSTASSASIMIRKMGRGVKRGTRSLVGLFRPKSVIGAPAADAMIPEVSQASVTMVTVEAERERVNVTADVSAENHGETGFPHLERNSIDTAKTPSMVSERAGSSGTDNSASRKSIVGGDKERAEVLAAVRKGILKNTGSGSSSPVRAPVDAKGAAFDLPGVPGITESPQSSAPSTPNDEAQGHKRTGSVAIGNEDYFVTALRLRQDTKSAPGTPQGTLTVKRSATFSPRIVFYDTWPSQEYDRRGEIATCNRLTPMLAQQIKEELNSFKMEMEVHENSKIYTHFF